MEALSLFVGGLPTLFVGLEHKISHKPLKLLNRLVPEGAQLDCGEIATDKESWKQSQVIGFI